MSGKGSGSRLPKPSKERWVKAVLANSEAMGVDPMTVLARSRGKMPTAVRWAAWAELEAEGKYSVSGIAKTSGYDHTSVIWALRNVGRGPWGASHAP